MNENIDYGISFLVVSVVITTCVVATLSLSEFPMSPFANKVKSLLARASSSDLCEILQRQRRQESSPRSILRKAKRKRKQKRKKEKSLRNIVTAVREFLNRRRNIFFIINQRGCICCRNLFSAENRRVFTLRQRECP